MRRWLRIVVILISMATLLCLTACPLGAQELPQWIRILLVPQSKVGTKFLQRLERAFLSEAGSRERTIQGVLYIQVVEEKNAQGKPVFSVWFAWSLLEDFQKAWDIRWESGADPRLVAVALTESIQKFVQKGRPPPTIVHRTKRSA